LTPTGEAAVTPPTTSPTPSSDRPSPLLNVRTAVILLIAFIVGVTIGLLTYAAGRHPAEAVLAGLGSTGAAAVGCHRLIG